MTEVTFSGNTLGDKALWLEGVKHGEAKERERRTAWLNRAQTMYPDKQAVFFEGYEMAVGDIIELLERLWEKTQGTDIPAVVVLPEAIALIKGETE